MFGYHGTQSALRVVLDHDMIYTSWYPFDVSTSPAFEIVNLTQVNKVLGFHCGDYQECRRLGSDAV
jgi:hypothetical protein